MQFGLLLFFTRPKRVNQYSCQLVVMNEYSSRFFLADYNRHMFDLQFTNCNPNQLSLTNILYCPLHSAYLLSGLSPCTSNIAGGLDALCILGLSDGD